MARQTIGAYARRWYYKIIINPRARGEIILNGQPTGSHDKNHIE